MTRIALIAFALLASFTPAAHALTVGLAIPQDGPYQTLGDQVRDGFAAWQGAHEDGLLDIVEGEDHCDAESGTESATSFVEAGVDVVAGYVCAESLAAALPVLSAEGIPVMTLTVRADIFAEEAQRNGWRFYRLAPKASSEPRVAAQAILSLWADKPFAIIEDGTILGRELADSVRAQLEEHGLQAGFIDNYRPGQERQPSLARRLKAAGVTRVFLGGERGDAAIIARDADEAGLDIEIMGGDALHAPMGEVPLPDGTLGIVSTLHLSGIASRQARAAFAAARLPIEGLRLHGYVAADIFGILADRLAYNERGVEEILRSHRFETAIGTVSFDKIGERIERGFTLAVWRGSRFERISPRQVLAGESNIR